MRGTTNIPSYQTFEESLIFESEDKDFSYFSITDKTTQKLVKKYGNELGLNLDNSRIQYIRKHDTTDSTPIEVGIIGNNHSSTFYVKKFESSRKQGLELSNFIDPTQINFIYTPVVILEEGIKGEPLGSIGDKRLDELLEDPAFIESLIRQEVRNEFLFMSDCKRDNYILQENSDGNYSLRPIDMNRMFSVHDKSYHKFIEPISKNSDEFITDETLYNAINSYDQARKKEIQQDEKRRIAMGIESKKSSFNSTISEISEEIKNDFHLSSLYEHFKTQFPKTYQKCKNHVQLLKKYIQRELLGKYQAA